MDDSDPIHNNPLHELAVLLSKGKTGMICAVIVQREGLSKYVGFNAAMDRNGRDSHFLQNFYSSKDVIFSFNGGVSFFSFFL